jgi:hypothetical protein
MAEGHWEVDYIRSDKETAVRANIMLIRHFRDLRETNPQQFKELLVCLRASGSDRIMGQIDTVDVDALRTDCRKCGGVIQRDVNEHEWNIQAVEDGYCRAMCKEEAESELDRVLGGNARP